MTKVNTFYIGPPKTASTWLHKVLSKHEQVSCSKTNTTNFFMFKEYIQTEKEYENQFTEKMVNIDFSHSYFNREAIVKILQYNPDAKFIIIVRDPIKRTWSHYWHKKKKLIINYNQQDLLTNYYAFLEFVQTSFYGDFFESTRDIISPHQLLIIKQTACKDDPQQVIDTICTFLNINKYNIPEINNKYNIAGPKKNIFVKGIYVLSKPLQKYPTLYYKVRHNKISKKVLSLIAPQEKLESHTKSDLKKIFKKDQQKLNAFLDTFEGRIVR